MQKSSIAVAIAVLSLGAWAQQPPSAGSQLQQIPPQPVPPRPAPELRVEPGRAPARSGSDAAKITVNSLKVTGQAVYAEADLVALTGFRPGTELSLAELRAMAAKIADYFHDRGYFLAQAYLPAQDIEAGVVTIAVLEGKYGNISVRNQSNLSESLASGLFGGLNSGDTIAIAPLETRLLLLSDLPGVTVKSTLAPGASVGASDLIVDVAPGQRVTGSVDADNAGNRYTGAYRLGGSVAVNNPSGYGDVLSLRGLTSADGLNYGRAAYQAQLGRLKGGVAYTALKYRLGREFDSLQASGTAQIASVYGSYPLIRSRATNLWAQLAYDAKTFEDKVDSTSTLARKKARMAMASLTGDHRDGIGAGGLSSYTLTWTRGKIDIRSADALATDAATANTNGHYDKWGLSAVRLQGLTSTVSISAALSGQAASKNLDISEKMGLGGADGVRAYPAGEAYGDQGYLLNLEARMRLPKFAQAMPGELQLIGFVDTGSVMTNRNAFTGGPNRRTLSGGGVGASWGDFNNFVVKAYVAHKIGNAVATSAPDASYRFWIQAVKYF